MSRIRSTDTKPEMAVRRLVYGMGYRYRLHDSGLPGNPDMVFRSRKKVIFVHGCFWHQHGCGHYKQPQTKRDFWYPKLAKNRARDIKVQRDLHKLGWESIVIWECEIKNLDVLRDRLINFLGPE